MLYLLTLAAGLIVGLPLGALWIARRISKATGVPMRMVILGGGPKPTGPV